VGAIAIYWGDGGAVLIVLALFVRAVGFSFFSWFCGVVQA